MEKTKKQYFLGNPIKVPRFEKDKGFYATAKGSATMSKIKAKHSKVEIIVRKALWTNGYRYRIHAKGVIGKPDIVFPKQKIAIFIDGDFWHGHNWEIKKSKLSSNKAYWIPKIERNIQRDKEVTRTLIANGWTVLRFWEHEVRKDLNLCIIRISRYILQKSK